MSRVVQQPKLFVLNSLMWLGIENFLRVFINGIFVFLIARIIGPEDFGLYAYVLSISTLFRIVSVGGIEEALVKKIIDEGNNQNSALILGFFSRIITSIFSIIFCLISYALIPQLQEINLVLLITVLSIFLSFETISLLYEAQKNGSRIGKIRLTELIIISSAKIYVLIFAPSAINFLMVFALEPILLGLLFSLSFYQRKEITFKFEIKIKELYQLLIVSLPYLTTAVLVVLQSRADHLIIENILGYEFLGYYSITARIAELFVLVPIVLGKVFFPFLLEAKSKEEQKIIFQELLSVVNLFAILIIIGIYVCAEPIIYFALGSDFVRVIDLLKVYSLCLIPLFIVNLSSRWLLINNLQNFLILRNLFGFIISLLSNLIFLPIYGLQAACYSIVICYASIIIFDLFHFKTRELFILNIQSLNPILWINQKKIFSLIFRN